MSNSQNFWSLSTSTSLTTPKLSKCIIWLHESAILRTLIVTIKLIFGAIGFGSILADRLYYGSEQWAVPLALVLLGLVGLHQCTTFFTVYRASRGLDILLLTCDVAALSWIVYAFDPYVFLPPLIMSVLLLLLRLLDISAAGLHSFNAPFEFGWTTNVRFSFERTLRRITDAVKLRVYISKGVVAVSLLTLIHLFSSFGLGSLKHAVKEHSSAKSTALVLMFLVVTITHHTLSFFVTPILHRGTDLLLLLAELVLLFSNPGSSVPDEWRINSISGILLAICFSLLILTRVCDLVLTSPGGISPFERYDILTGRSVSPRISILLGRTAWTEMSLKGEPVTVKVLRALLAISALGAIIVFSVLFIARGLSTSYSETGLKQYSVPQYSFDFNRTTPYIIISPLHYLVENQHLSRAIKLTQDCYDHLNKTFSSNCSDYPGYSLNGVGFACAPPPEEFRGYSGAFGPDYCETRIEVDFTLLDPVLQGIQEVFHGVNVRIGGANITDLPTYGEHHLLPFTLFRDENLMGQIDIYVKEVFDGPNGLNLFGYGGSYKQLTIGTIFDVRSDNKFRPADRSSLRLRNTRNLDMPSLALLREYNDHTVLDAFANLGGLWTFANGMFAMLFGGSLLYFLLGVKPLSRFGLVHMFLRGRLRRATRSYYPRFHTEGGRPGDSEAGVVAFLREHLVGVISDEESTHSHHHPLYPGATNLDVPFSAPPTAQMPSFHGTVGDKAKEDSLESTRTSSSSTSESDLERIPLEPLRYDSLRDMP